MNTYNYTNSNYVLLLRNAVTNGQLTFIKLFLNSFSSLEEKKTALKNTRDKALAMNAALQMPNPTYEKILDYLDDECLLLCVK